MRARNLKKSGVRTKLTTNTMTTERHLNRICHEYGKVKTKAEHQDRNRRVVSFSRSRDWFTHESCGYCP